MLAPPCVPFFTGDNFGTTYPGVTRDEIRVLYYLEGGPYNNNNGASSESPKDKYFDLGEAPQPGEFFVLRYLRGWQRYFNTRFQTYDRSVRFYVYFTNNASSTPEKRITDAADNFARIKPFAVVPTVANNVAPYLQAMAREGVLGFTARRGVSAGVFQEYPGLIWGYQPSVEEQAAHFGDYLCTKVIPHRTSFSGNLLENDKPRRLGLLRSNDPRRLDLMQLAEVLKREIAKCGGAFADEQTFPNAYCNQTCNNNNAAAAMGSFKQSEISTIIWPGGYETTNTQAAAALNYRPEWILNGDGSQEGNSGGKWQESSEWQHAWIVTNATYIVNYEQEQCYQAYQESDPQESSFINIKLYACGRFYESSRQLFTGIQIAGPRLNPASVDKGFHAIPDVSSTSPKTPACFYRANDYTCVKDAVAEWWDATGPDPTTRENTPGPGCWRMAENGKRYPKGRWPEGDVLAQKTRSDVCNGYQ